MEERFNIETLDKIMDEIIKKKIVPFSKRFRIVPPSVWDTLRDNHGEEYLNDNGVYLDEYK